MAASSKATRPMIGYFSKRPRDEESEDERHVTGINDVEERIASEFEELLDNESNKISKIVASNLRLKLRELLSMSCKKRLETANLKGRLQERSQPKK